MRPSRQTSVISLMTSSGPANRATAVVNRAICSVMPSSAEYWTHRRHRDAIGDDRITNPKRRKHRGRRRMPRHFDPGLTFGLRRNVIVYFGNEVGIALAQVFMRQTQRSGQQAEAKLPRLAVYKPLAVLEPLQRRLRRSLQALTTGRRSAS